MTLPAPAVVHDLGRLRSVAGVLIRHGFGDLAHRLGMIAAVGRTERLLHWKQPLADLTTPQRAVRALEELGPTFVKLGQVMATRVDLFPPEWIAELERLQDQVPTVPFETLRPGLEAALGAPIGTLFGSFEETPLAAGSLAQVHGATLPDGRHVVVKIRRPGIRSVIEADLRLLARIAGVAERDLPELRRFRPRALVRQLSIALRRELDFEREGRAAERIANGQPPESGLVVPRVHWGLTRESVNVQERIVGIPAHDLALADAAGLDRARIARRGAEAMLRMILIEGFFHADPHAGNLFLLPGDRIALIDFGMVGRLSEPRRREVADLLLSLAHRDAREVRRVLAIWTPHADGDEPLAEALDEFLDRYHGVRLERLNLGAMLADTVALLREHRLWLPPDLAMLVKALITLEGFGRRLDPGFDMAGTAQPYLHRVLRDRYRPRALLKRGVRVAEEFITLAAELPRTARRLLAADGRGRPRVTFDLPRLDRFGRRIDRAASRIAVGLITAALIIGTSIVMTVSGGPTLLGLPLFGLVGFVGAVLSGVWLVASIWRGGHSRD